MPADALAMVIARASAGLILTLILIDDIQILEVFMLINVNYITFWSYIEI